MAILGEGVSQREKLGGLREAWDEIRELSAGEQLVLNTMYQNRCGVPGAAI